MLALFGNKRENLLRAPYLYEEFAPELIRSILDEYMSPSKMRVDLLSSTFHFEEHGASNGEEGEDDEDDADDKDDGSDIDDDDEGDDDDDDDEDDDEEEEEGTDHDGEIVVLEESRAVLEVLDSCDDAWEIVREPHFHVVAHTIVIPTEIMTLWQSNCEQSNWSHYFSLPPHNPFIPRALELFPPSSSSSPNEPPSKRLCPSTTALLPPPPPQTQNNLDPQPALLIDHPLGHKLFFIRDHRFCQPKVVLNFQISSPSFALTVSSAALLDLILFVARDALTPILYLASLADLDCQMVNQSGSLCIRVVGFSDIAWVLAALVISSIIGSGDNLKNEAIEEIVAGMDRDIFADHARLLRCRDSLLERMHNDLLTASKVTSRSLGAILIDSNIHPLERIQALESDLAPAQLTSARLSGYVKEAMQTASVHCMVQGNASSSDAKEQFESIIQHFASSKGNPPGFAPNPVPAGLKKPLSHGQCLVVHTPPLSKAEKNVAAEMYFYISEYSTLSACQWYLLETCLSEPFFDTLRTKEQLGYEVSSSVDEIFGAFYMVFKVVSSTHPLPVILGHMVGFVQRAVELVEALDESHLPSKVYPALLQGRQSPDLTLRDASERAWKRIIDRSFVFDRRDQQVAMLQQREVDFCDRNAMAQVVRNALHHHPKCIISLSSREEINEKEMKNVIRQEFGKNKEMAMEVKMCKTWTEAKTIVMGTSNRTNKKEGRGKRKA